MHCPNCGKPATSEQFCRACGMNLESVGKLVAEHSPSLTQREIKIAKAEAERAAVQRMIRWMSWGLLVLALGVLLLVANKSFNLGKWFGPLASVLLISGIGIATYGLFAAIRDGTKKPANLSSSDPEVFGDVETTRQIADKGIPVPVPSVTERTTELLETKDNGSVR